MKAFAIVSRIYFLYCLLSYKHFAQVLLAVVATKADSDAEADAYTLGQIAYGLPQANAYATGHPHNVGVITGVDYGHGRVSGYGAIGNRGYYGGHSAGHIGYSGYGGHIGYSGYGGHFYGKREAEADSEAEPEADADAYTFGQIAYGLPQHNAYATGHPHNVGVITGVDYGHGRVSGYGAIGNRGYYGGYSAGYSGYGHGGHIGYSGYGGHYYGKREADSDSDAYTLGQIAYGLPQHNAYATGHPHNVGVITGVDYGHGRVSGYGAIGNRGVYGGYHGGYHGGYAGHRGYAGYTGAYYG